MSRSMACANNLAVCSPLSQRTSSTENSQVRLESVNILTARARSSSSTLRRCVNLCNCNVVFQARGCRLSCTCLGCECYPMSANIQPRFKANAPSFTPVQDLPRILDEVRLEVGVVSVCISYTEAKCIELCGGYRWSTVRHLSCMRRREVIAWKGRFRLQYTWRLLGK